MPQATAQSAAASWAAAMKSATTKANYVAGINATTVNPMALAATPEATQRYLDGIERAISTGKRAKSLNSASVATWKTNATTIGAGNLTTGATKAQGKYQSNIAPYAAVYPQMKAAAAALPSGGIAASQAKAAAALAVLMQAAGYPATS